jgi:hypothetical protein
MSGLVRPVLVYLPDNSVVKYEQISKISIDKPSDSPLCRTLMALTDGGVMCWNGDRRNDIAFSIRAYEEKMERYNHNLVLCTQAQNLHAPLPSSSSVRVPLPEGSDSNVTE